jgi:hypothetical protein
MKSIVVLLSIFSLELLCAQIPKNKTFQLTVYDSETQLPIKEVAVRYACSISVEQVKSDSLGQIFITCSASKIKLSLVSEFYKPLSDQELRESQRLDSSNDTLVFQLYLEAKEAKIMRETVVTNPYKPQQIFGSERLSVADFEILEGDKLLLLTYERKLNQGTELLLVDNKENVLFAETLKPDALHLFKDFRGLTHLMYKHRLDYVHHTDDAFSLVPVEKNYYHRFIAPIIDTNKTKFYFSNYRETYPAADFFVYDDLDSTYFKISRVADDVMMDLYLKEYLWVDVRTKLWAREMEQKTGIEKEKLIGETIFTQSVFYKEIYAPMFLKADTIYLFDFYKHNLKKFDLQGTVLDSTQISIHLLPKKTGWKNRLIQDPITGCVYALFDQAGYVVIRCLNLLDGTLGIPIKLELRYVEKLIIHNNEVYYTYRPYESQQKKFLYKQSLPLFYRESETAADIRK